MPIDYRKYPLNWKTEIRPRILKRANNCCENCKVENGSIVLSFIGKEGKRIWIHPALENTISKPFKEVTVVLTIAHLDHDEGNHQVEDKRLKALCQLCHLRYDAAEKKRRKSLK